MKSVLLISFFIFLVGSFAQASIIDAPHNETGNITCGACHKYLLWWQFSPLQADPDLRLEKANVLCLSCHGESGQEIHVINHSSASLGSKHRDELGDWSRACVDCHDPHFQAQLNWYQSVPDTDLFLVTGQLTADSMSITGEGTSASPYYTTFAYQDITVNAAEWENAATPWAAKTSEGRGLYLVIPIADSNNTYEIINVDEENTTIKVKGVISATINDTGSSFGLIYGQLIRDQIEVNGNSSDVKFFNAKNGFIDVTENNEGICQVCHTQTRHFRNDGTVNAEGGILDHTALAAENCIACHAHTNGFAHGSGVGAGCGTSTACHGLQDSHPPHVDPAGMVGAECSRCHNTDSLPDFNKDKATLCAECHDDGTGIAATPPDWGTSPSPQCSECHKAAPDTGSHPKHLANAGVECSDCHESTIQSAAAPSQHLDGNVDVYDATAGDLGYPADKAKGSAYASCSTAVCHDDGTGGTVVTPIWGQTADACSACHAAAPTSGSHNMHLVETNYKKPLCSNCHKGAAQGATPPDQHLDENIDVYSLSPGDLGYQEDKAKNSAYDSCSSTYCHSSGQSITDGADATPVFASPTWGAANGAVCGTCHKVSKASGLTSGSHGVHLGAVGVNGCGDCHSDAANDGTSYPSTNHVDGSITVADELAYTMGGSPGNGYGTCGAASCHDDGRGTPAETPEWGDDSVTQCSECHKAVPETGSHQKHVVNTAFKKAVCGNCHKNAVQSDTAPDTHLDGNVDIMDETAGDLGYPVDKDKGSDFANCSSAYCHSSGQSLDGSSPTPVYATPAWGGTVVCGDCHKTTSGTNLGEINTGSHSAHLEATGVEGCGDCHSDAADDGTSYPSANHVDGSIDVGGDRLVSYDKAGTPGNGYGTCAVTCHTDGRGNPGNWTEPEWGAGPLEEEFVCLICHLNKPVTGSHELHLDSSFCEIICADCHNGAVQDSKAPAQHVDNNIDVYEATPGDLGYPADKEIGSEFASCSNFYCHSQGTSASAPYPAPSVTPTWGGDLGNKCFACHDLSAIPENAHRSHLNNPEVLGTSYFCSNCHFATVSGSNFDIKSPENHINKKLNIKIKTVADSGLSLDTDGADNQGPRFNNLPTTGEAGAEVAPGTPGTCSNVYCHSIGNLIDSSGTGDVVSAGGEDYRTITWTSTSLNCSGCHGDAASNRVHPVYASGPAGSATANSHIPHVENKAISCDKCHIDTVISTSLPPTAVNINSAHLNRKESVSIKAMGGSTGSYNGTVSQKNCSNTYCHSTGQSTTDGSDSTPSYATPQWGNPDSGSCGTCHKISLASGLTSGSHAAHLGATGVNGCGDCHTNAANNASSYDSATHVDGSITVAEGLAYAMGGSPGNGYGTCSTASCHDNGRGTPAETPEWGDDSVTQCSECHKAVPETGSHQKHVVATSFKKAVCGDCHKNAVQSASAPDTHLDGNVDIMDETAGDLGYPIDKEKGSAFSSCSTAYCHSSGQSLDGASATPVFAEPAWGTTVSCGDCHKTTPGTTLGRIDSGSHLAHLNAMEIDLVNGCGDCHSNAANDGSSYGSTNHVNRLIDVAGSLGYDGAGTPGNGYGTCSSASCHNTGTPKWGGSVSCQDCHLGGIDVDDFSFNNGAIATIDGAQWLYSGHGRPSDSGEYDVSGNPAADFSAAAVGLSPCGYCHDSSANHGEATNPFRLANVDLLGNGLMDNCLACHGTAGTGYDPDAAGPMALKTATVKIDQSHHGYRHGENNDGGSLCWDCHDPHGDRDADGGNIFMMHSKVTTDKADTYGSPATDAAPVFTNNADGSDYANTESYNGICQVCHTSTSYYRNAAGAQEHFTEKCISCHSHGTGEVGTAAFNHGSGSGGEDCVACHGHEEGTLYDPDMSYPYLAGENASQGKGTTQSHSTHTEIDNNDKRGPGIYCDSCHDLQHMPRFKNQDGSGNHPLEETNICDNCHSSGGSYNGVDSENGSTGAKDNWSIGIYNIDGSLKLGREKWCAGCHDEVKASSNADGTGVVAPNVVGDEDGSYVYGTGWGYYKTGHGLASSESFPASGGITNGAGILCADCHDQASAHLDGNARSFSCESGGCSTSYKEGYRLKDVNGNAPMTMPPVDDNSYRLCFSCHTNTEAWLGGLSDRNGTNYFDPRDPRNDHYYHMTMVNAKADLDWDGVWEDGNASCTYCHNVHGSTNPVMIRDGSLNGRAGFVTRYGNSCDTDYATSDITLAESTILASQKSSFQGPYCATTCHGTGTGFVTIPRDPVSVPNIAPELEWVGGPAYSTDGVNPDAAESGSEFTFKVEYRDINQDPPAAVQLWIDRDADGAYEDDVTPPEKIDMTLAFAELNDCANYSKGVDYVVYVTLNKGDLITGNTVKYTFRATDQVNGDPAAGLPTNDSTLTILNDAPKLSWTGEVNYKVDGVNPNYGPNNGIYTFAVRYIDDDGDSCPASDSADIQVWIDENSNNIFDAGEKYNLTEVPGDTNDCSSADDGKIYYVSRPLHNDSGSDKTFNYIFRATDGVDEAFGEPNSIGGAVTVSDTTNNPPLLAWNTETCRSQGAMPPRSATISTINFSVRYYDEDNECPVGGIAGDIMVYVDLNNNGNYLDDGEQIEMEPLDADTDCTTVGGGKLYEVEVMPTTAANGIPYEFHATDGNDEASGDPRYFGGSVDVMDADVLVKQDGSGDYTSISSAITGSLGGSTILVYDGIYNESPSMNIIGARTIASACGPEETVISSSNDPVVLLGKPYGTVFDGFTVTGGSGAGIKVTGTHYNASTSYPTIKNSIIRNNSGRGIWVDDMSNVTLTDSEIYNNSGGGVYRVRTITDSIIRDNSITGDGGGIYGSPTLTNVIIKDNTATGNGGGIYCYNAGHPAFAYEKVILAGNTAGGTGGGGYFDYCYPTFTNSLISDNSASRGGGLGVAIWAGVIAKNSTLVNNRATTGDGGLMASTSNGGGFSMANSIAWGNRAATTGHIVSITNNTQAFAITIADSIVENNGDGIITDDGYYSLGNFIGVEKKGTNYDTDPNFVNPHANGDYHIQLPSDSVDNAGDSSGWGIPADDLDEKNRPLGSEDIGAYEY